MPCVEVVTDAPIAHTREDTEKRIICPLSELWWYLRYLHMQPTLSRHGALSVLAITEKAEQMRLMLGIVSPAPRALSWS